jgi:hypothetical protein
MVFFVITAFLSGCSFVSPSNSDDHIVFGDAYRIQTTNPSNGEPAEPFIDDGDLVVVVSYSGGCADHKFEFDARVISDTARIWLEHDGGGDACEAYITQPLRIALPQSVVRAPEKILMNPDGENFEL